MAANKTLDLDILKTGNNERRPKKFNKIFLIVTACVLVAALAVAAVLLMGKQETVIRIVDFGTALKGVSVGGVDISGMTKDEAIEATAGLEGNLLSTVNITLDVNGEQLAFKADDFGITTDYQTVLAQALEYGHTGTFDERKTAAQTASGQGVNFDIKLTADENTLHNKLAELKAQLDKEPQDATCTFAPWGYNANADGTFTPYTPDLEKIKTIVEEYSHGREYTDAQWATRVRLPEEEMPIPARYEYWKDDGYVENFRPVDANISRFIYTPEVNGLIADTDAVFDELLGQIQSDSFSTIIVPVEVTEATVKLADIKANTQMIASWTSYFGASNHYNPDRNYNVGMISSLINGNILQPGVEWSVNHTVGDRNSTTARTYGWREAAGIENGGYTPQYGGGVCQLGSTTYNAAIRSGITIIKSKHHTIPSDYVPLGLDATLSSGDTLDLILRNDNTVPYYIVSYINPKDRNVTVEIYGPPLIDPAHPEWGNVIYDFSSKSQGRYGTPVPTTIWCSVPTTAPDGTVIDGVTISTYEFAKNRLGTKVQTYKTVYALDGTVLSGPEDFTYWQYPVINGTVYQWGVDPATITPPPAESTPPAESPPAG